MVPVRRNEPKRFLVLAESRKNRPVIRSFLGAGSNRLSEEFCHFFQIKPQSASNRVLLGSRVSGVTVLRTPGLGTVQRPFLGLRSTVNPSHPEKNFGSLANRGDHPR